MLSALAIRDIVLIEKLDLSFEEGLSVLTGETGAGKSILLDAFSLALGARSDRGLVRAGADKGRITASFSLKGEHPALLLAAEHGLEIEDGELVLRRQISSDGRSKAWVNEEAVSRQFLAALGALLVEIHGQHDDRSLLDPASHRRLLDSFASHLKEMQAVRDAFEIRKELYGRRLRLQADMAAAQRDEDFLKYAVEELSSLGLQPGEEAELAAARTRMMQGEKLAGDLENWRLMLGGEGGAASQLKSVLRQMERLDGQAQPLLAETIEALDRAAVELDTGISLLEDVTRNMEFDPRVLEETEERLFEIRRLARKHSVQPEDLVALLEGLENRLAALERGGDDLAAIEKACLAADDTYRQAASKLTESRRAAAKRLDTALAAELAPLKLEKASFETDVKQLEAAHGSEHGQDRVEFQVKTNPNTPYGPLTKIASGGETARFILALKVVLAKGSQVPVMVFDEVDRGIGGATADAVGERLSRLAEGAQVLVVTHSPQVAARGAHHLQIEKSHSKKETRTTVRKLLPDERLEEVARMLAGAEITEEARAAAKRLVVMTSA